MKNFDWSLLERKWTTAGRCEVDACALEDLVAWVSTAEQERDTQQFRADEIEYQRNMAMQTIDSQHAEIESLRAQLKAAQEQEPVCWRRPDDTGHWIYRDDNPSKSGLIWDALYTAPIPAQQSKEIRGSNEYGLDMGYLEGKLNILLRDIDRHRPDEAARVLARLAKVADEKVLSEPEFAQQSPAVAQGELIKGEAYQAGLWSMSNAEAMIEDGNAINGQSPAVPVPDNKHDSESPKNIGNEIHNIATALAYSGSESIADELGSIAVRLWALDPSPRITEQDAREIVNSFKHWFAKPNLRVPGIIRNHDSEVFPVFMDEEGRALLDKLNNR